jgi:hypothetical protein
MNAWAVIDFRDMTILAIAPANLLGIGNGRCPADSTGRCNT